MNMSFKDSPMPVSTEMLTLLACPRCAGALVQAGAFLTCGACRLKYPVRQGIPVLLLDEAQEF